MKKIAISALCVLFSIASFATGSIVLGIIALVYPIKCALPFVLQKARDVSADKELCAKTVEAIENNTPLNFLDNEYAQKKAMERNCTLEKSFSEILTKSMEDGIITDEEEAGIQNFIEHFNIDITPSSSFYETYDTYIKMLVIKNLLNGHLPTRIEMNTDDFFLNLEKDESVIWCFSQCEFLEETTYTTYVSKGRGSSVRIAKGFYLRSSSATTTPIKSTGMEVKATGSLIITTKNVFFYSTKKSIKIPYKKVVSFTQYSNGIGVQKDGNSKPQAFIGIDGWFAYNIVINAPNLEV